MRNSKRILTGSVILALSTACCAVPSALKLSERPVTVYYNTQDREWQPEGATPVYSGGMIGINDADIYELQQIPGIGETISGLIIDERELNGPFNYPEDLLSVRGIGTKKLEQITPYLYFDTVESEN